MRADLAILGSSFTGIEIKSAKDTLRRLEAQLAAYERYFERSVLIVAEGHLPKLDRAALHGAELWAITTAGKLQQLSEGTSRAIETAMYLDLLTKAERERILLPAEEAYGCDGLSLAFRTAFSRRYQSASDAFWDRTTGRRIYADDLRRLSRFADIRTETRRLQAAKAEKWSAWMAINGIAA